MAAAGRAAATAAEMEKGEALETNIAIGRLISCASSKFKRTREEASQLGEKSTALATAYKELEEMKADRDNKAARIDELNELVNQRTAAAKAFEDELAKAGMLKEKIDFSQRSARENASASSSKAPVVKMNMDDALFGFINSGPSSGGARIMQSNTSHGHLGSNGGDMYSAALAAI